MWPLFAAITPDEVSSCGWVKKDKWEQCPHICAMTQRFNHVSNDVCIGGDLMYERKLSAFVGIAIVSYNEKSVLYPLT